MVEDATEYVILEVCEIDAATKMVEKVNRKLKDGWRLLGGPSISKRDGHYITVFQAMVRGGDIYIPGMES